MITRRHFTPKAVSWGIALGVAILFAGHGASQTDTPSSAPGPSALQASSLRAQILPKHFTTLSNELPARIDRIHVPEGARFKAGETLVSLDCVLQKAQLEKARAALTAAEKVSSVNARLAEMKTLGGLEVITSAAEAAKARAEVALMQATVSKCTLAAPFAGRVAEQKAREHQYLQAGQPILDILDDSHLEIEFIAPSLWLAWLKADMPFTLHVDETRRAIAAKVLRIGARVDSVSQSIKVTGAFTQANPDLLAGMSGRVEITPPAP
ncbi:MAG: efflux RND transporter periplasmic adaptor subunit [Magnetococcales bacterium]|nr:efflux RND transporter periplasmic adaptor subunit [Magnetococcales bacterium]